MTSKGYEWHGEFLNFKMKTKIKKFEILQQMNRKFAAIQYVQQNHQDSIFS
jgi:hypothetical protein